MRSIKIILTIILFFIAADIPLQAQMMIKRTITGDFFDLPEVGAFIILKNKMLTVDAIMPAERRPEAYKSVDLSEGDNIIMVNARKVSSIDELKKIYNDLKSGGELKMALQRGSEKLMTTIIKADPQKLPKRQTIKIAGGKDMKIVPAAELGLLLEESKGRLIVRSLLPNAPGFIKDSGIKENDQILEINGKVLKNPQDVNTILQNITTGEEITLKFRQNEKEKKCKGKKPEVKDSMKIDGGSQRK